MELLATDNNDGLYVNPEVFTLLFATRYPKNSKPYVVLFKSNNKPIAMIIGATHNSSVPIKIGYLSTNTPKLKSLDIEIDGLITNGQKESENAIIEYLRALLKQKKIDKLEVVHLSETHKLWKEVKNGLGIRNTAIFKTGIEWSAKIRDTETGEQISYNSSKTRGNLKRADKKLRKHFNGNIEVKEIVSPDQIDYFIENADTICRKSYLCELGVGIENNEYWRKSLSDMAKGGLLRGYLLIANSEPISYTFGLVYKNTFYLFATAFNSDFRFISPGGFLIRRILELLVKEKVNYFHFGYGDAEYKKLYGNESKTEASFRIYGFTNKARISKILDQTTVSVHESVMGALEKTGYLNKIKKFWRSKLSKK